MLTSIFAPLAELLGLAGLAARMRERADAEKTGALKQQHADQGEEMKKRDAQLTKAVNRQPGDARKRLEEGKF